MSYTRRADVAVVGCGPAGIAASIQLRRSGAQHMVFEKERIGGLLPNANLVENYPGFPDGISGVELALLMGKHLEAHSVEVIPLEVARLGSEEAGFALRTSEGDFHSRIAIVATGTRPKPAEGLTIDRAAVPRVFYEILPIMDVRDKHVAIVGAGDAAFDYAMNLGRHNRVTILNRTDRTRCLGILGERARALASIEYVENTAVSAVTAAPPGQVSLQCRSSGGGVTLVADYLVFATGREPELGLLSGWPASETDRLRKEGLLHLVGDVTRGRKRQTAIAVGDGVGAALSVCEKLRIKPQ
jgi:thioredoxin reductase (NADPH)